VITFHDAFHTIVISIDGINHISLIHIDDVDDIIVILLAMLRHNRDYCRWLMTTMIALSMSMTLS